MKTMRMVMLQIITTMMGIKMLRAMLKAFRGVM